MTEPIKETELEMPNHIQDIRGDTREVLRIKSSLIKKFGYAEWEKLIRRSSITTIR